MRDKIVTAYLGLGSNMGDRFLNLQKALEHLKKVNGVKISQISPVYETDPVGGPRQPRYLNTVVEIGTDLEVRKLLKTCQEIENEMGRIRTERWGPRVIDIDILIYGDLVISTKELIIPHPLFHEREFVLRPMADIVPDLIHPVMDLSIRELLEGIEESDVKRMSDLKLN
jgi:2-amino-4-hydroxy-6-hydroxymethyldihydropteridine diphosphokinase